MRGEWTVQFDDFDSADRDAWDGELPDGELPDDELPDGAMSDRPLSHRDEALREAVWSLDEPLFGTRTRWPLDARGLLPRERPVWYEQLWTDACMLRERYRLGLRSGWWEDDLQVEAIAALGAWIERYDSGEWDDPPGKLALLYDLERVGQLLRDGREPFHPVRDRAAFERYVAEVARRPPGR